MAEILELFNDKKVKLFKAVLLIMHKGIFSMSYKRKESYIKRNNVMQVFLCQMNCIVHAHVVFYNGAHSLHYKIKELDPHVIMVLS